MMRLMTGVARASNARRRGLVRVDDGSFVLTDNAKSALMGMRPKSSESSAHGFIYVSSKEFHDLMDEMVDRDLAIAAAVSMIVAYIETRELILETDEKDERATKIRDAVREHILKLRGHFGFSQLVSTLVYGAVIHGLSINEIVWELKDGLFVPAAFVQRHPGQFGFDELGEPYILRDVPSGLISARVSDARRAEENKFIVMRMNGRYGDPFGESAIFGVRWVYALKKGVLSSWVDFADTYGTPLAVAKIEKGAQNIEDLQNKIEEAMSDLRVKNGITLPPGVDLNFQARDGGGQSKDIYDSLTARLERAQVRFILGSTLSTMENEGTGSLAQARVHSATQDTRTRPVASALQDALQDGIINPFVRLNFGDGAPAPRLSVDTETGIDVEQALKIIDSAVNWNIDVTKAQAREWTGIRLPSEGEEILERTSAQGIAGDRLFPPGDSEEFAERKKRGMPDRNQERSFGVILENVALAASEDAASAMGGEVMDALARLGKKTKDKDAPLPAAAAAATAYKPKAKEWPGLRNALIASKALAAAINGKHIMKALPGKFAESPIVFADASAKAAVDGLPSEFRESAQWMLDRKVMSVAEVRRMAESMALLNTSQTAAFFESELRREILAISAAANTQMIERFQSSLAAAIRDGRSFAQFFEVAEELRSNGSMPIVGDGYIENVFRTETALMYERQREAQLQDPDLVDFYWGDQLFNRNTEGSRETHRAIDGLLLERGSDAYEASRPGPPWSYQCTCTRAPVIVADVRNSGFKESPGALDLVRSIVRFESE